MTTGIRKPKARMLSAILRICFFEWRRGLEGCGLSEATSTCSMDVSGVCGGSLSLLCVLCASPRELLDWGDAPLRIALAILGDP